MLSFIKSAFDVVKQTVREFSNDDCSQMAASLAFYTVLSLPALLVLIIMVAGLALGEQAVEGHLALQMEGVLGSDAAEQVQQMVARTSEGLAADEGYIGALIGAGALIFAATRAFAQLQIALNRVVAVRPDPDRSGLRSLLNFFVKRALSFGMIVAAGFLLLVTLVLSTAITAIGGEIQQFIPIPLDVSRVLDFALSFVVATVLFAGIFGILPDARIPWRSVWTGAAVTALLFVTGKVLIGIYLGRTDPGSTYGAAGSLVLLLMWIYLSSMLLLIGAEFTQVWARRNQERIEPATGAVRVVREIRSKKEDS